jgi:hypothetical protein
MAKDPGGGNNSLTDAARARGLAHRDPMSEGYATYAVAAEMSIAVFPIRLRDGGTEMKYMLMIYLDEQNQVSEAERQACYVESMQLAQELHSKGQYLGANPLHPTSMATSVRVRDGKRLVTDGPFAETREQLGGYFLVEANNLDEAIGIAARIPMARKGTVEVRPVIDIPGLPA